MSVDRFWMLRCSRGGAAEYSLPGQAEAALESRDGAAGQHLPTVSMIPFSLNGAQSA